MLPAHWRRRLSASAKPLAAHKQPLSRSRARSLTQNEAPPGAASAAHAEPGGAAAMPDPTGAKLPPLTPEQQRLLDQWQQADNSYQQATFSYWQAHDAQLKAPDYSLRLRAFNAQRTALDAQIKAYKWLGRACHACRAADFSPTSYLETARQLIQL